MKKVSLIACVLLCAAGSAPADTVVIVHTGHPVPGGNGNYGTFTDPVLNYYGQLVFRSNLSGTSGGADDNQGIFLSDNGVETVMCRTDWLTPNGNGRFDELNKPALNRLGQVVFRADARDTTGGSGHDSVGIYRSTGPGTVFRIARANTPAPDGNGWFDGVSPTPVLDNVGGISFTASFRDTTGGASDENGVVSYDQGTLVLLARGGQTAPGGDGQYSSFSSLARNNHNVMFKALLTNTSRGGDNDRGVYKVHLSNPASHDELVREGDPAPDGNGEFISILTSPIFNNLSRTAFTTLLGDTSGGGDDNHGVYLAGTEGVIRIARSGQAPPDGNGVYNTFPTVTQGDLRASFIANIRDTSASPGDIRGVYWGNGLITRKIVRAGEAAVDGNGDFFIFNKAVSAIGGQTAFEAMLTGTALGSADNTGLYVGNGYDLLNIARTGDPLLGSVITDLSMATNEADYRSGINSMVQIAYRAVLADSREVLVLYTPEIKWKNGNGSWEGAEPNWTLGILPNYVHDVTIAPIGGAEVIGPRVRTTVKSLTIGDAAALRLVNGGDFTVVEAYTVMPGGAIVVPDGVEAWMHGPLDNQGSLDVAPGAIVHVGDLTGQGSSGGGIIFLGGDVRPASGIGLMRFDGHPTFDARCTTYIELDPDAVVPTFDRIVVEGDLVLDGTLVLDSAFAPAWLTPGRRIEIIDVTGRATGQFLGLDEGARLTDFDGVDLRITYTGGDGNNVELYVVPEPATLILMAGGLPLLLRRRRRHLRTRERVCD